MPAALGLVAVALALGVRAVSDHYEHQFLSTGPNGRRLSDHSHGSVFFSFARVLVSSPAIARVDMCP